MLRVASFAYGLKPRFSDAFYLAGWLLMASWASTATALDYGSGPESPPFSPVFASISAGTFLMGSPENAPSRRDDEIQHLVTLTRAFMISTTEVTQGLWQRIMGENPSYFAPCDSCPVERVSYLDALRFCNAYSEERGFHLAYDLSAQTPTWNREANGFRLPTEAEWEYASRAGTTSVFATGDCLTPQVGNYNGYHPLVSCPEGMNRGETIEVGRLAPNRWGLLDMHGNVAEWCWDIYDEYSNEAVQDPEGPEASARLTKRVFRGGSFLNFAPKCRSANREALGPTRGVEIVGLRLVRWKDSR